MLLQHGLKDILFGGMQPFIVCYSWKKKFFTVLLQIYNFTTLSQFLELNPLSDIKAKKIIVSK
jgi:hypothetical protein